MRLAIVFFSLFIVCVSQFLQASDEAPMTVNGCPSGLFSQLQPPITNQWPVDFDDRIVAEHDLTNWFKNDLFFSDRNARREVAEKSVVSCDADGNLTIAQKQDVSSGNPYFRPQTLFAADNLSVPYLGNNYLASVQSTLSGQLAKAEIALTDIASKADNFRRSKPPKKTETPVVYSFQLGVGYR